MEKNTRFFAFCFETLPQNSEKAVNQRQINNLKAYINLDKKDFEMQFMKVKLHKGDTEKDKSNSSIYNNFYHF